MHAWELVVPYAPGHSPGRLPGAASTHLAGLSAARRWNARNRELSEMTKRWHQGNVEGAERPHLVHHEHRRLLVHLVLHSLQ